MSALKFVFIAPLKTKTGKAIPNRLSYQVFGKPLGTAPVVLVNHALTGNSNVAGQNGWWNSLIGPNLGINTDKFTVLAFNLPGNGYDGLYIDGYRDYTTLDMARALIAGLETLSIDKVFAVIGGSLGGCIAWQMAVLRPKMFEHLIPIAAHWCASDWLIALCRVQQEILENSARPVHDARLHAMTFYRSPESLGAKFNRSKNATNGLFNTESWLMHHGKKLESRFSLSAYKLFNWLLLTHDITNSEFTDINLTLERIEAQIWLVGVSSDRFFIDADIRQTLELVNKSETKINYKQIESNAGHDAFLIEYEQLAKALAPVFSLKTQEQHTTKYESTIKKSG